MKKTILVILSVFLILSCGNSAGSPPPPNPRNSMLIGIFMFMPEPSVERWVKDGNAIKNAALALGYQADLYSTNADQNEQNSQIMASINKGAKLIIVSGIDSGIVPVIEEAKSRGITVIFYDRLIFGTGDYGYFITFNNYLVGQMQGQSIINALDLTTPKKIVLFAGAATDGNSAFFFNGAMDVLNPKITAGDLIVADGETALLNVGIPGWDPSNVNARLGTIFPALLPIDAVLGPNDNCARYIIDYYESHSPSPPYPIVTGQDGEFDSALSIKNNKQYMTVFRDSNALGRNAVTMADQILQGQAINVPGVYLATGPLKDIGDTGAGIIPAYLMDPKVITKTNLQELRDAEGWFTDAQKAALK